MDPDPKPLGAAYDLWEGLTLREAGSSVVPDALNGTARHKVGPYKEGAEKRGGGKRGLAGMALS